MAQTKLQSKLSKAFTDCAVPAPWNLLNKVTAYEPKYEHPIRTNTMSVVRLYYPIVKAASLFSTSCPSIFEYPFRMVLRNKAECILEAQLPDGTCIVIVASKNKLRMNIVETDGTRIAVGKFADMSDSALTMIALSLIRFIYEYDMDHCGGKLFEAADEMVAGLNTSDPTTWTARTDIPDRIVEGAYYMDAAMQILKEKMVIDCGPDTSNIPGEIEESYFTGNQLSGELVVEYLGNDGWEPQFVTAAGRAAIIGDAVITIDEAKEMFKDVFAHRNWTEAEKSEIRKFPGDMPVMPEAIRIASRIAKTRNSPKPVAMILWRGITSYGKSTGVQQVSCILNIPMKVITCNPGMETQDFLCTTMPRTSTIGLKKTLARTLTQCDTDPLAPRMFKEAMAYLGTLPADTRDEVLHPATFFELASMDPDAAVESLVGEPVDDMEFWEVCSLFTAVTNAFRESPLLDKIKYLEEQLEKKPGAEKEKETDFVLVVSPFLQALAMGYLVEVQEASRIRNQGALVGLNEYDRAGAKIRLQDGQEYTRHKDAIVIYTDNVGYDTCRQMDPSVIRRFDFIIDSHELPKDALWVRSKRNVGCTDKALFEECYKIWLGVQEFCQQNAITDGCVSATELERYVQAVMLDGRGTMLGYNLDDCIISKATCDIENQKEIRAAVQTVLAA